MQSTLSLSTICSLLHSSCRTEGSDEFRQRVHNLCGRLLRACGGPASPLAFEMLVWLDEVASTEAASAAAKTNGIDGRAHPGMLSSELQTEPDKVARLAAITVHRFPACGTAWAVLGLTLARRCIRRSKGDPSASKWAGDVAKAGPALAVLMLEHGCTAEGGGTAAASVALTRLRLRAGHWEAALAAVASGMAWVRYWPRLIWVKFFHAMSTSPSNTPRIPCFFLTLHTAHFQT